MRGFVVVVVVGVCCLGLNVQSGDSGRIGLMDGCLLEVCKDAWMFSLVPAAASKHQTTDESTRERKPKVVWSHGLTA